MAILWLLNLEFDMGTQPEFSDMKQQTRHEVFFIFDMLHGQLKDISSIRYAT